MVSDESEKKFEDYIPPKILIDDFPLGYAYHKVVVDDEGKPIDYIFLQSIKPLKNSQGYLKMMSLVRLFERSFQE